jgi:hypothetical protein
VGSLIGSFSASPINAWSFEIRRPISFLAPVTEETDCLAYNLLFLDQCAVNAAALRKLG